MGEADGSFMEVDTLESLRMLPRNHTTKKLLAMTDTDACSWSVPVK